MNSKLPAGEYCAYLRKSRADLEEEVRGAEDTYVKHERMIMDMARRNGLSLTKIYREKPITGERISARPEMIQLLADVEEGFWKGVLVVEVERLARGDTMDQGLVAQAFKYSNTLILTPMRFYDPSDPNDEEYFEFGLFMSRREFKTITRRLQGGRVNAVKDGNFIGSRPPYGYERVKLQGVGHTLKVHPDQAPIVQLIFTLYTDPDPEKQMGTGRIAAYLNDILKVPTSRGTTWIVSTINAMLRNPIYIGKVRWGSRPIVKKRDSFSRPRMARNEWLEVEGHHPPLITEDVFRRAQEVMASNSHAPAPRGKVTNPLAGLIKCAVCGAAMILRPSKVTSNSLICVKSGCKNVGSYFELVEQRLIHSLKEWIAGYKDEMEDSRGQQARTDLRVLNAHRETYKAQEKKLRELESQKSNLFDLLEQKVYTVDMFMERSKNLEQRIKEAQEVLVQSEKEIKIEENKAAARTETIPRFERALGEYESLTDPAQKNALLKAILIKVDYYKEKGGRWHGAQDSFVLRIHPRIVDSAGFSDYI